MVDPSILRSARVVCASAITIKLEKNLRDIKNIFYEEQGEWLYPGKIFQRSIVPVQTINQIHHQLRVAEAPKKTHK